jgi:uncharacterized membrane protein YdjX (TVP38/TMEM64 family)
MRLYLLLGLLLTSIIVPFWIWGAQLEAALSLEGARAWLLSWGSWAWAAGVLLIVADLFIPVPSTVVMSALGLAFGWFWGGLAASLGGFLAGALGYALSRSVGRSPAVWIAGADGLAKAEALFVLHGAFLVALSRFLPVLPEAVACLAGVVRMPARSYFLALACGSLPVGFAFAAVGQLGQRYETLALVLSGVLPISLWLLARRWLS